MRIGVCCFFTAAQLLNVPHIYANVSRELVFCAKHLLY